MKWAKEEALRDGVSWLLVVLLGHSVSHSIIGSTPRLIHIIICNKPYQTSEAGMVGYDLTTSLVFHAL